MLKMSFNDKPLLNITTFAPRKANLNKYNKKSIMKKEIYENPKVEIVDLGTEDAICDSVVCASPLIQKTYSGFHRYGSDENLIDENGVVDYGESPFGGSSNRGF